MLWYWESRGVVVPRPSYAKVLPGKGKQRCQLCYAHWTRECPSEPCFWVMPLRTATWCQKDWQLQKCWNWVRDFHWILQMTPGWWLYPSEKWWSSSVGVTIPNIWKNKKCSKFPKIPKYLESHKSHVPNHQPDTEFMLIAVMPPADSPHAAIRVGSTPKDSAWSTIKRTAAFASCTASLTADSSTR